MLLVKVKPHVPKKLQAMTKNILKIVIRKWIVNVKFFVNSGRRRGVFLVPPLVVFLLLLWPSFWWFTRDITRIILPPAPKESMQPINMYRNLKHYIKYIKVKIEPNDPHCGEDQVIAMVASSPRRADQRAAVRETWARLQPTFFVLGIYQDADIELQSNYEEARLFGDLIIFDFHDHYQNQTLKTALMMRWTVENCPKTQFLLITVDDVLVNPWTLNQLLMENSDAPLIGYMHNDVSLRKYTYNKWYIPESLRGGVVSKYLSGTGYLVRGNYINKILKTAYEVPIFNLQDIYFTYLVAHKKLGLELRHDRRLSPYKPWLNIGCVYWGLASVSSFRAIEMVTAFTKIENLVLNHDDVSTVCKYLDFHSFDDFVLF